MRVGWETSLTLPWILNSTVVSLKYFDDREDGNGACSRSRAALSESDSRPEMGFRATASLDGFLRSDGVELNGSEQDGQRAVSGPSWSVVKSGGVGLLPFPPRPDERARPRGV